MPAEKSPEKVVLLVSGGPDSATLALLAEREFKESGTTVNAIYLRTGHASDEKEIEAANRVVQRIGGKLEIVDIADMVASLGGRSILIHSEAAILPLGNAIVLNYALAYAMQIGATRVLIGLHQDDADENKEYTEEFVRGIESLARSVHQSAPVIDLPLIRFRKSEVIRLGLELGVDFAHTWSCIRRGVRHCGQCGACRARRRAFQVNGLVDPTEYSVEPVALETVGSH